MKLWEVLGWLYEGLFALKPHRELVQDVSAMIRPDAVVLDAGCGTGMLEHYARRPDITALDYSSRMLKRASRRCNAVLQGDVTRLPFGDNTFDQVISINVLYAVPAHDALHQMARVMRPGGELILATPTSPALLPLLKEHWHTASRTDNLRLACNAPRILAWTLVLLVRGVLNGTSFTFHTPTELTALLEANGFSLKTARRCYAGIDILLVATRD